LHRKIGSKGRNRLAKSGLNRGEYRGNVAMRLHTYRDENRSRHFDLISGGQHPRSIDLVMILTSSILVIAAACARALRIDDRRFGPVDPLKTTARERRKTHR
jgi:hypothetical protein